VEGGIASRMGARAEDRYGMVIVLVILSYGIAAAYGGSDVGRMVMILVQLVTVWLVFTVSEARRAQRVAGGMVLVLVALIALVVLGSLTVQEARWATDLAEGPLLLVLVALYALTPVVIVAHVIRRPGVDREAFFGGVAAYLLIGMTYAFTYVALGEFPGSQPFFGAEGDGTTAQCLFFSFTTLTTTGYGDLVPAGNPGQSLAISEAVIGQLFLVTALGKIVSNLPGRVRGQNSAAAAE
jgi:hypothetical protein